MFSFISKGNKNNANRNSLLPQKAKEKANLFGPLSKGMLLFNYFHWLNFNKKLPIVTGKSGLVEKTTLIKHANVKDQEDLRKQAADRTNTSADNQAFLTDVSEN